MARSWRRRLLLGCSFAAIGIAAPAAAQQDELSDLLGPSDSTPVAAAAPAPAAAPEPARPAEAAEPAAAAASVAGAPAATASETVPVVPQAAPTGKAVLRNRLVEEIVVTAQKREENIQDVPIAITAFSAEKLDALGIQAAQDLERITPGLTITNAAGFNVAYLRGVGTDAFLPGADPSVPFYLDGVPLLGAQGSTDTLGRVQRVEVLKGPQGTLFGRNATGGAVSIVTPDPIDEFVGDVGADFGNYNFIKGQVYVNLPIAKGLATSISGYSTQQDNFYTNDTGPIISIYSRGGRAKLRWDPIDDLRITLAGSYAASSNNGGLTFENTRVAPILSPVLPQDPKADRHVSFDSLAGAKTNSYLFSGTFDWKTHYLDIKLIGSDQRLNAPFVQSDFDKSNLPIVNIFSVRQVSKQYTGELQFLSNDNTPFADHFKWVGGLFFLQSSGGFNPIRFDVAPNALEALGLPGAAGLTNALDSALALLNLPPIAGDGISIYNAGILFSRSYSAYFQGTLKILDSLDLTLGGRLQHEDRDLRNSHTFVTLANGTEVTPPGLSQKPPTLKANQASPRIALQYRPFADDPTQIYASWSRAYKEPTYNTVNLIGGIANILRGTGGPQDILPIRPERVNSFELGIKTDLLDGGLRLDAALFYTKQHDLLTGFVSLLSGGVVTYTNTPAAEIKGAEMDFVWAPLPSFDPGLAITGAASYIDAHYTDYPDGQGFDTVTGISFGNQGTEVGRPRDFKGNRVVRTPYFTGNLGINQSFELGDGRIELAADTNYNSGFYFLPQDDPLYARNKYQLVNARVTYFYEPWKLQISGFVQNLTNKDYNEVIFVDDFGRNQVLNSPRTFGGRVKWSFGN